MRVESVSCIYWWETRNNVHKRTPAATKHRCRHPFEWHSEWGNNLDVMCRHIVCVSAASTKEKIIQPESNGEKLSQMKWKHFVCHSDTHQIVAEGAKGRGKGWSKKKKRNSHKYYCSSEDCIGCVVDTCQSAELILTFRGNAISASAQPSFWHMRTVIAKSSVENVMPIRTSYCLTRTIPRKKVIAYGNQMHIGMQRESSRMQYIVEAARRVTGFMSMVVHNKAACVSWNVSENNEKNRLLTPTA